ncbi:hypothetical protein C8R44DRAFT_744818 [Mycena epipterygia]|nr:hypothetical protein C8R44DRAFT_744818 [Mycena epipterygia]
MHERGLSIGFILSQERGVCAVRGDDQKYDEPNSCRIKSVLIPIITLRSPGRAEVLEVLNHKLGTNIVAADQKKFAEAANGTTSKEINQADPEVDEPPFRIPPTSVIAGVLIREWAYGKIQFPAAPVRKGNL